VNFGNFDAATIGIFVKGYLRFDTVDVSPELSSDTTRNPPIDHDVTLTFTYSPLGWQHDVTHDVTDDEGNYSIITDAAGVPVIEYFLKHKAVPFNRITEGL
jgi:hypothetical protein